MSRKYTKISFDEAKEILDSDADSVIVDVREENEFCTGHAENAVLLPVDEINKETAEEAINSYDTIVMVYCRTGQRSRLAAQRLVRLGYKNVRDLGSLIDWPYGIDYD